MDTTTATDCQPSPTIRRRCDLATPALDGADPTRIPAHAARRRWRPRRRERRGVRPGRHHARPGPTARASRTGHRTGRRPGAQRRAVPPRPAPPLHGPRRVGEPERRAARERSPGPGAPPRRRQRSRAGWAEHDVVAKTKVDRFLAAEYDQLPAPNAILKPKVEGDVKVFELTIDEIEHRIDAQGTARRARLQRHWPGPRIRGRRGRPCPGRCSRTTSRRRPASISTARTAQRHGRRAV